MRVTVLYGLAEGPAHLRRLRPAFDQAGFTLTQNPSQADILIAHSAGAFDLPADLTGKVVVLVAPSYRHSRQGLARTMFTKIQLDIRHHFQTGRKFAWTTKSIWNAYYFVTQPTRARRMHQAITTTTTALPDITAKQVVVISYRHDPWSAFITPKEIQAHPTYRYISLSGAHDDLWTTPGQLAKIIQSVV